MVYNSNQNVVSPMARQLPREDLFTPIHEGVRSMIYELGTKLQRSDFTDVAATDTILKQLRHNLQSANSLVLSACCMNMADIRIKAFSPIGAV